MVATDVAPLSPVPFEVSEEDLAFALRACAGVRETDEEIRDLVADPDVIVTASARAAFDLVLGGLGLTPGDEVLFTPTIGKMPELARARALVPVFVDLDPDLLAPAPASLARALGPRARVLVVAHLFGARVDVGPAIAQARARGVVVIEDRAQAFHDRVDAGHAAADAVIHSFGVLKTASACGGGLLRVRDARLRARIAAVHAAWPEQATGAYARVVLGHLAARWIATRRTHAGVVRAFERLAFDVDPLALRVVAHARPTRVLRRRPSPALLAVLARRLQSFAPATIDARVLAVRRVASALPRGITHVGGALGTHGHWVLPILAQRPDRLVGALRRAGFHATRRLVALEAAPRSAASRLLEQMLYLPYHPWTNPEELARMIGVIQGHAHGTEGLAAVPSRAAVGVGLTQNA